MAILTTLILLIKEHRISSHSFLSFSHSFISVYSFQNIGLSPSWLSLFPGILFFSHKWDCSLNFFYDSSLLVYTKAKDFCKLITEFCLLTCHGLTACLFFPQPWTQQSLGPMNLRLEAKMGKISKRCSEK